MLKIGGHAYNNGVCFISDNYKAKFVVQKDETCKITSVKRIIEGNFAKKMKRIPFIRGIFMILRDKIPALLIGIIILSDLYRILDYNFLFGQNISTLVNIIFGVLTLLGAVYVVKIILLNANKTRAFHGAEHKTIYTYDIGKELTLENVKESPRTSNSCGTNFVIFLLPLIILQFYIIGTYGFVFVLSFILAYELFKLPENLPIIRVFYSVGNWLQQNLFTSEPTDKQIIASIGTIEKLISLEVLKSS